jgi:hypothetical protein
MPNSADFGKNRFMSLSLSEQKNNFLFVLQENLGAEGRSITKEKAGGFLGTCLSFLAQKIPEIFPNFFKSKDRKIYANMFVHECISKHR